MFVTSLRVVRFVCPPLPSIRTDLRHVSQEIEEVSSQILAAEEVLLEALCFDFVIDSPHADLIDLFDAHDVGGRFQDFAWSIAHDSSVGLTSWALS